MRTLPFFSSVAVAYMRASFMLPVATKLGAGVGEGEGEGVGVGAGLRQVGLGVGLGLGEGDAGLPPQPASDHHKSQPGECPPCRVAHAPSPSVTRTTSG